MAAAKKAFGGYSINFKGCNETIEEVFGKFDANKDVQLYFSSDKVFVGDNDPCRSITFVITSE